MRNVRFCCCSYFCCAVAVLTWLLYIFFMAFCRFCLRTSFLLWGHKHTLLYFLCKVLQLWLLTFRIFIYLGLIDQGLTNISCDQERYSLKSKDTHWREVADTMRILNLAFMTLYCTFILDGAYKNAYRISCESKKVLVHTVSKDLRIYSHWENNCWVHWVMFFFLPSLHYFCNWKLSVYNYIFSEK